MALRYLLSGLAAAVLFWHVVVADPYFFNNTDLLQELPLLSTGCYTALNASVDCDPSLKTLMLQNYFGPVGGTNATYKSQFCRSSCQTGMTSYRSNVAKACASDPQPRQGIPATWWADVALSAFNHICLVDPSSKNYCADVMNAWVNSSAPDSAGTDLSKDKLCSNCTKMYFQTMQATPFSNYNLDLASVWSSIQKTCGWSLPTAVQSLTTNVTTPGGFAPPGSVYTGPCLSGKTYTVVSGDNCQAIAKNYSVSTGTLIVTNSLYRSCSNLRVGQKLCIPASCTTYVVQSGDTCGSIASKTSNTFQLITAYNPAIDDFCTNLLSGENICVSPPGGAVSLTTIAGNSVTQTNVYASSTAPAPSPVASGTTKKCGKYYLVQPGDYCQLVALNQTIDLGLFEAINPQINSTCGNLLSGFFYCVKPTADWNTTATSTVVAAPTNTPPGTTTDCYQYYTIQSGDYCGKVEDMFSITMGQLQYWNPSLQSDCSNLILGDAYCVNGVNQPQPTKRRFLVPRDVPATPTQAGPRETAREEGGVPVGWPGLKGRQYMNGYGKAREL